jgi:hypothetical protein
VTPFGSKRFARHPTPESPDELATLQPAGIWPIVRASDWSFAADVIAADPTSAVDKIKTAAASAVDTAIKRLIGSPLPPVKFYTLHD